MTVENRAFDHRHGFQPPGPAIDSRLEQTRTIGALAKVSLKLEYVKSIPSLAGYRWGRNPIHNTLLWEHRIRRACVKVHLV
jgi:hypothetical protein